MCQILIVEDDRPFADVLARMLQQEGFRVLTATDAEQGVRLGVAHRPDVVIADWMLGNNMHGGEVCRRIHAACPSVRCIVMTGYLDAATEAGRQCEYMEAIVAKPFHKEEIIGLIRRASGEDSISEPEPSLA
jgi:DNA-binding response OmpR family regulator